VFSSVALGSLSRGTSRRIDWTRITDVLRVTADRFGEHRSGASTENQDYLRSEDLIALQSAFSVAEQAFRTVLRPLRNLMRLVTVLLILSIAVTIAGAALAMLTRWASILSVAGLISMFGLLTKAWTLARDRAMLELIPARYELALKVCTSKKQAGTIVNDFLKETNSARR